MCSSKFSLASLAWGKFWYHQHLCLILLFMEGRKCGQSGAAYTSENITAGLKCDQNGKGVTHRFARVAALLSFMVPRWVHSL